MAQTTQIVPEFSFPHVMTVVNDYTKVKDVAVSAAADTFHKQIYAVTASKGIDNVWVKLSSRAAAVKMFGDSNFKKYGQPLMQALEVLDKDGSQVWMMRVMPDSATYANKTITIGFKSDVNETAPHKSAFRIKLTSSDNTVKSITEFNTLVGAQKTDAEGYTALDAIALRYVGRGKCGNNYSLRMGKATAYESEYGITMYNFECINSEVTVEKDAAYVGSLVTSAKYDTATFIEDVLSDASTGTAPIMVKVSEGAIEAVYDAYVKFVTSVNSKLVAEYTTKLAEAGLSDDVLNGVSAPETDAETAALAELKEIEALITATKSVPDVDEFDPIFGKVLGSSTESLPLIKYVKTLTDSVDASAADYDSADYTSANVIALTSVKGVVLAGGADGEFENPTKETVNGVEVTRTVAQEVEDCLIKAYNGTYDRKILSSRRMPITAYFDANYPFEVKKTIVKLAEIRGDRHVWLDAGIVPSISAATAKTVASKYSIFDTSAVSVDVSGFTVRETTTNKKYDVTASMFLAPAYVDHCNEVGLHIPFVKDNCVLTGHVKDSVFPLITEADKSIIEILNNNRINFFECYGENQYQRAIQNTTQKEETDLLEENNDNILKEIKYIIEDDVRGQIYNFADEGVRSRFIAIENAKFNSWKNNIVNTIDISFQVSEYEFEKSILHCYVEVVFRGLTKSVIVEIDLNKREFTSSVTTETEE